MPSGSTRPAAAFLPANRASPAPSVAVEVQPIWRRIRRDVVLLGAGNVAVLIAQLGFRGILITALAPAAYGRLALIFAVYNTVWIVGASGLPNALARYLAISPPECDSAIVRSAIRAGAVPIAIAAVVVGCVAGVVMESSLALLLAPVGLAALVGSLLTMGILRGRGRAGAAAAVMPVAALAEMSGLLVLWRLLGVSPLSAFAVFCLGNLAGLAAGVVLTRRTAPTIAPAKASRGGVPGALELLRFSVWVGAATIGIALLPLVMRAAASLDSYTVVAVVDVALVLFAVPQRMGTVIVLAVVPHASRAIGESNVRLTMSMREHLLVAAPFALAAIAVAFTPLVALLFGALGRPVYATSASYLALALLAGPARILYGVVEGVLVAHGDGRFLALSALTVAAVASGLIFAFAAASYTVLAFAVFAGASWLSYLAGLTRMRRRVGSLPAVAG
jgi:O-antigen/teichoic acid export membrane protein